MKTFKKKYLILPLVVFLSIQFSLFFPRQTQAGSLGTIKSILGTIESIVVPWPLPIKSTEIFALIDLVNNCQDLSDDGLMACVDQASGNSDIGPMLESSAGVENIKLGLNIYLDLKNSDYIKLIKDGGKPIGCAAAQILTGIDVCGAIEELIAIGGAVGEAIEYSLSWLDDLDVVFFGQTPHMDTGTYYNERWRPYIRDYVSQKTKAGVTNDTLLKPYAPPWVFSHGGTYAEFGLTNKSLNQVYADCQDYYNGFKDDNGGSNCSNNLNTFNARVALLVKEAEAVAKVASTLQGVLDGQVKIWNSQLEDFKKDLVSKYPQYDVLNAKNNPPYLNDKYNGYAKLVTDKVGVITGGSYCVDPNGFDCVDFDKGSGTCCNTIAYAAFQELYASDFKTSPGDAITKAVGDAQPKLKGQLDVLKKQAEEFWANKVSGENVYKKSSMINAANSEIKALRDSCKTLSAHGDQKYPILCYDSEPMKSCSSKIEEVYNKPISLTDPKAADDFVKANKPGIDTCLAASKTVVNEWKRMDQLVKPFVDGWLDYYNKYKDKKSEGVPSEQMKFSLVNEFNYCASDRMKQVTDQAVSDASGVITLFLGQSTTTISFIPFKISQTRGQKGKYPKYATKPPVIAEGFCAEGGEEVANPNQKAKDPFASSDNSDKDKKDPSKPSATDVKKTQDAQAASSCKLNEMGGTPIKIDSLHLVCKTFDSYKKCMKAMDSDGRPGNGQCFGTEGKPISDNYVIRPCCEPQYTDGLIHAGSNMAEDQKNKTLNGTTAGNTAIGAAAAVNAKTFKITSSTGMGGMINPMGAQTVKQGAKMTFTISANPGFKIKSVTGCGIAAKMGNTYETSPADADCKISVAFEAATVNMNGAPTAGAVKAPGASTPAANTPATRTLSPVTPAAPKSPTRAAPKPETREK